MRPNIVSTLALAIVLSAASAYASNQPPHDFAHNVTCNSCHVPYRGLNDPSHAYTGTGAQGATSLSIPGATFAPGQWIGGVVTFTSGPNEYAYRPITGNTADTVSWVEPLPATVDPVSFEINKLTYDDVEMKCKACHNPTGPVPGEVGLHETGTGGVVGCGKCHDPHNTVPNSGWTGGGGGALIRAEIRLPQGGTTPVSYDPAGGDGRFVTPAGDGVCQACHTKTAYYREDGSLQTHQVGQKCATCHGHQLGFGGGASASGHFDATSEAWGAHAPGWSQGCLRCHTQGGFKDYVGESDGKPNYLGGSFNTNATTAAYGPMTCTTCHNAVADPQTGVLTQVLFPSLAQVTVDHSTALCGQCHQARESTASIGTKLTANVATANKGLGVVSSSANAAGTTTTIVRTGSTWPVDAYKGYSLLFTTGPSQDSKVTVTGNDATTITFTPALAAATASGVAFTMWPTATAGGTTSTIVDTGRAWTVNQWAGFYVFVQTGVNRGLYRQITANTATALTLSGATTVATPAGSYYQILPKEDTAIIDAQLASSNSFVNSHYLGAAATLLGGEASGWYQYPLFGEGATAMAPYSDRNYHGVSAGSCASCHSPHTLEVTVNEETCGRCHFNEDGTPVGNMLELEEARQYGFAGDIDGDGLDESLKVEVEGLATKLYAAVQAYAANVVGTPLCYNQAAYPYLWTDTNGDGTCGNTGDTQFAKFTPRLLRAMYNYNFHKHEPGAWAHNPRYAIEALYDGIVDLNAGLLAKGFAVVPFSGRRAFEGHFGAASDTAPAGGEQFRDWDTSVVSSNCSQCHAGEKGLENYLANPLTTLTNRPVNGMQCTTCHDPQATDRDMTRMRAIASVRFPPRSTLMTTPIVKNAADFGDPLDTICATCHSGREAKGSIDARIGATAETSWTLGFANPHYLGAAGIAFGTDAKMAYEYAGKTYAGQQMHHGAKASCVGCHDPRGSKHTFEIAEVAPTGCKASGCHGTADFETYKSVSHDSGLSFDGHAPGETLKLQVQHISDALLARIKAYAAAGTGGPICYNGAANPYWFKDDGTGGGIAGNGVCEPGETTSYGNAMNPSLLRAAFNYQWSQKEPGAWAHNFDYIVQVMYDSIEALGGDTTGLVRP